MYAPDLHKDDLPTRKSCMLVFHHHLLYILSMKCSINDGKDSHKSPPHCTPGAESVVDGEEAEGLAEGAETSRPSSRKRGGNGPANQPAAKRTRHQVLPQPP